MKRIALALTVAVASLTAAAPAASADVDWLCKPGLKDDPCEIPLDTTTQNQDGTERVDRPKRAAQADRPVDCFYVYPTVSNQSTPNANKDRDPELVSIAKYQAARFSSQCRIYAPIYRQGTLLAIATAQGQDQATIRRTAYADVVEAWKDYLRRYNRGRGVILIGHSQGTRMLRALIHKEIDRNPAQRKLLAGGVLLGGNVTVAKGKTTGGDFRNVPLCTRVGQVGCVTAYSTYAEDPPENSRFGKSTEGDPALDLPGGPGYEVACTDPGRLSGQTGPFGITEPSERFAPGPIAAGIATTSGGMQPTASTTWVTGPDRYTGACRTINGAHVFRYDPTPGSRRPAFFPDPTWGTHLVDVNLGYDRLVTIAGTQAKVYRQRSATPGEGNGGRSCAKSKRIRVTVRPRNVKRGRRTRFRIRATRRTGGKTVAVKKARVRINGRTFRTNRRGRVTRRLALRRAGRRAVTVTRKGLCRGRAFVRVKR